MKRQQRRLSGKMLGIGDGANDVAMIQAADVGIGIMGKEGRQVTFPLAPSPAHSPTPPLLTETPPFCLVMAAEALLL